MPRSREEAAIAACAESKTEPENELTDEQWSLIADLFPESDPSPQGGRPTVPARQCFEGICWVLRRGARWKDLPSLFPSYATCWRRHKAWTASGVWERAWTRLLNRLSRAGKLDADEAMADGTFASAKKGVAA
jgi:transposase